MISIPTRPANRARPTLDARLALLVAVAAMVAFAPVAAQAQPAAAAPVGSRANEAQQPPPPDKPVATGDSLRVEQRDGVSYVSGGIGEERDEIERLGRDFNLRLTAAAAGGKFSVPEAIRIADQKGNTLLDLAPRGPILLAKLPAGTYTVAVTTDGKTRTSTVSVPSKGQASLAAAAGGP